MIPLAEKLRPKKLQDIVGQTHLLGEEGLITRIIAKGNPLSIILWGPPGCGKTTIAHLYAEAFSLNFVALSAVFSGVADLKKLIAETKQNPLFARKTLLFIDEIHRFNKAQQDAFLPYVEDGTIVLVGATTENPSYHLNNALLSRVRVLTLNPLTKEELEKILNHYESSHPPLPLSPQARDQLLTISQGDGRYLLNMIENLQVLPKGQTVEIEELSSLLQKRSAVYDKHGEYHYNLISALHKSVRGSDPDAALYWLCRMLEGGEDPLYIARRLIRMAVEDIGLADPQALPLAIAARDTYEMLGSPEGELALAELILYLALAPKSNATYTAYKAMRTLAAKTTHLTPPKTILNAPTQLMKELDYGKDYQYDHDKPQGFSGQHYFPEEMERHEYYQPVERGFEREMKKRLHYFQNLRKKRS